MSQAWAWIEHDEYGHPLNTNFVCLCANKEISWNGYSTGGRWHYYYDQQGSSGVILCEFSARGVPKKRKHLFHQIDDNLCKLVPAIDEFYNRVEWQWDSTSVLHANETMITLQKIKKPEDLEEMVQAGGGHATASGSSPVM